MKTSAIDRWVYAHTKKPRHYVEVRNPPKTPREKRKRPQDARQVQYNRWCKRYGVYSGSYLPDNPQKLLKKGWKIKKISESQHQYYQRKSTNQTIRHDSDRINRRGNFEPAHYHWYTWWRSYFGIISMRRFIARQHHSDTYYNKYGEKTSFKNTDHHIYHSK